MECNYKLLKYCRPVCQYNYEVGLLVPYLSIFHSFTKAEDFSLTTTYYKRNSVLEKKYNMMLPTVIYYYI